MSWGTIATLMLPENLLLAGIVALIGIEIVLERPRGALAIALVACVAATAAALWLYATGVSAEPFPGHFSVSPAMSRPKSSGLPPIRSNPASFIFFSTSGCFSTALISALSRTTIGRGVPAGTSSPFQASASNFGRPASARVGNSGVSG